MKKVNKNKSIEIFMCPKIHNPIGSYFSGVYMTLLSVIQGMALAGIFTIIWDSYKGDADNIFKTTSFIIKYPVHKYALMFIFIIIIWHKYINHHQFLGWQIIWLDSVIVFIFGAMQAGLLIVIINNSLWFYFIVSISFFFGAFAYFHALKQHKTPYVKELFKNYYCKNNCAKAIYEFMCFYEQRSIKLTLILSVIFTILSVIIILINKLIIEILMASIMGILLLFFLIRYDIKYMMKHSKITLKCVKPHLRVDIKKNKKKDWYLSDKFLIFAVWNDH